MKTNIIVSYFAIILLTAIAGCAGETNEARWLQSRHALTGLQDVALIAHESAVLTDDEFLGGVVPVALAARDTLEKAKTYLPEGGTEFEIAMDYVSSLLIRLEQAARLGAFDE